MSPRATMVDRERSEIPRLQAVAKRQVGAASSPQLCRLTLRMVVIPFPTTSTGSYEPGDDLEVCEYGSNQCEVST